MRKKKEFDCVTFKYEMFAKAWKKSGAANMREYIDYVNANAKNSSLYKSCSESTGNGLKIKQEC